MLYGAREYPAAVTTTTTADKVLVTLYNGNVLACMTWNVATASSSRMSAPAVLNVHTPTQSFAIVHSSELFIVSWFDHDFHRTSSVTQENLETLYDKLTRKTHTEYHGDRVGPGWLKYEFNETVWNLDDGTSIPQLLELERKILTHALDSDYTIFVWRQQQDASHHQSTLDGTGSSQPRHNPTLHLHNPTKPLPSPLSYLNPAFYLFSPSRALHPGTRSSSVSPKPRSSKSRKSKASKHTINSKNSKDDGLLTHQKAFEKFHGENGVRTVMGSIGPVQNGAFISSVTDNDRRLAADSPYCRSSIQ